MLVKLFPGVRGGGGPQMRILNDEVLLGLGAHPAVLGVALSEPLDSGARKSCWRSIGTASVT
jgi:hypothetical protein